MFKSRTFKFNFHINHLNIHQVPLTKKNEFLLHFLIIAFFERFHGQIHCHIILPLIQGAVADATTYLTSYIVVIVAVLYILWFGVSGSKVKAKKEA